MLLFIRNIIYTHRREQPYLKKKKKKKKEKKGRRTYPKLT